MASINGEDVVNPPGGGPAGRGPPGVPPTPGGGAPVPLAPLAIARKPFDTISFRKIWNAAPSPMQPPFPQAIMGSFCPCNFARSAGRYTVCAGRVESSSITTSNGPAPPAVLPQTEEAAKTRASTLIFIVDLLPWFVSLVECLFAARPVHDQGCLPTPPSRMSLLNLNSSDGTQ